MLGGGRCPTNGTVCAPRCAQVRRGTTWARARGVCACWLRNAAALTSPSLRSSTRFAFSDVASSDTLQSNSQRACYQCSRKPRRTLQPELLRPSVPFLARVTTTTRPALSSASASRPCDYTPPSCNWLACCTNVFQHATSSKQLRSDATGRRHYPGAWCCRVACQPRGCGRVRSSRLEAGRQALEVAGGRQVTAQAGQAALHCVDTYAVGRSVVCCTYGARRNRPPAHRTYL